MPYPPPNLRAFTLVELLVVLAIIAILAALVFSGVRSFIDNSRNARSTGNLREISRLHHVFIQENNGWLGTMSPRGENGHGAAYSLHLARIAGLISSVNSPKPTNVSAMGTIFASPWNGPNQRLDGNCGYGFNTRLGHNPTTSTSRSYKLSSCPVPSKTIVFAETPTNRGFWNWFNEDPAGYPLVRDGKVLVAWLDGHVSRETTNKLNETVDGFPFYYWDADKIPGQNPVQY
jgi:prepilin-type N-terminal cleavage/methylation domain-containing protein